MDQSDGVISNRGVKQWDRTVASVTYY